MKREDYLKFIEIAPRELPSEYRLLNFHTACDGEYMWQFISRVINRKDICFDEKHLDKFHGFPYMVGIDIYPLDYRAPSEEEEKLRSNLAMLVMHVIEFLDENTAGLEEQLCLVEKMCNTRIDRNGMIKQQLYCLAESLISLYQEAEAQIITRMVGEMDESRCRYPKYYYQDTIMLPFENTKVPVPVYYDAILKSLYGEYWKPVHSGGVHDYPFYKKQAEKK